jgi:hypothetical protein
MRLRALTAAAVAAWSKTAAATTAAVLPGVLEHPAGASVRSSTSQATYCTSDDVAMDTPRIVNRPDPFVHVDFKATISG